MFSMFSHIGLEVPFTILLVALLALRARVTPRTSLWIDTSPARLWSLLDIYDGKVENWGSTKVLTEVIEESTQSYRKTFATTQPNGTIRTSSAQFRVSAKTSESLIELTRQGLEGKPERNELLKITHELISEKNGTRLKTTYQWGPRALIAQLLARADLWGGAYRIKGLAETGIANEIPYIQISALVAIVTGLISLAGFALLLGLSAAFLLIIALFVHEFGHLLAYRLMGQPWGRMMFLPFLGAVAMPRLPHESQGQSVFAALMGPGFSVLLAILCMLPWMIDGQPRPILIKIGIITAVLNLFNLLPAEPLDGGIALRSVFTRMFGGKAYYGLFAIALSIVAIGFAANQMIFVIFGSLACFMNLRSRVIDLGLVPLSRLQVSIAALGYAAIGTSYISLIRFFASQLVLLNT